jgi:bile acid-coenzyme A ligase
VPVPARWDLPDWERDRLLAVVNADLSVSTDDLDWISASAELDADGFDFETPPNTHGICSSGSTGTPKVILMDVPGVWQDILGLPFPNSGGEVVDIPRPQKILVPTALYHTNGWSTLNTLLGGDELVIMERFNAGRALDLIQDLGITTFTATPTMLQRISDEHEVRPRDISSILWILQGAAVIPEALVRRWIDLIGAEGLYMAYGMTEGLGFAVIRGDEWLEHPGSVGQGFRGTEIRILDELGHEVPPGTVGEIHLRSPAGGLYKYLGGAKPLPKSSDGFASAGDLGSVDADGFLYIADRRSDMILTGGANVFPAEVESALIDHPLVADVVVIGLSDEEWGRRVHAIVEPADPDSPPDDLIAFAKGRLAAYKVPKTVEFVDAIPRSASTKVSRGALVAERENG